MSDVARDKTDFPIEINTMANFKASECEQHQIVIKSAQRKYDLIANRIFKRLNERHIFEFYSEISEYRQSEKRTDLRIKNCIICILHQNGLILFSFERVLHSGEYEFCVCDKRVRFCGRRVLSERYKKHVSYIEHMSYILSVCAERVV